MSWVVLSHAGDTNKWCCAGVQGVTGEGEDCCSTGATTTLDSFPYSTVTVISAVSKPSSARKSLATSSSSPSTSSQLSTAAPAPATSQQPLSLTSSRTSAKIVSATETPASPATAAQQPSDSRNVAIGAGVGVPLGILALGATMMLLYRDRRVKKQIRQLQDHLKSSSESPIQQGKQDEPKAPVYGEVELETGIDRSELSAAHGSHEASGRQFYEMT